jgi:hypothetical protein
MDFDKMGYKLKNPSADQMVWGLPGFSFCTAKAEQRLGTLD